MNEARSKAQHYVARVGSIAHVQMLAWLGYQGSRQIQLDADVRITNPQNLTLGPMVHVSRGVKIECNALEGTHELGRVTIGEHVFIGERTTIVSHAAITIGKLSMIGHSCSIMDFNHGTALGMPMSRQRGRTAAVCIGDDCWLGAGVIVLPGVTIGNGTIVGAGSVVTRSLPENVLAAGVPAQVRRPR